MILISFIMFLLVNVYPLDNSINQGDKDKIEDKILPLQRDLLGIQDDSNDTIINQILSKGITLSKDGFKITPLMINTIRIPAAKVCHDDCLGSVIVRYYIKDSKPLKLEKYLKPLATKITLSLEERKNPNKQLLLNKLLQIEDTLTLDECILVKTRSNHLKVRSENDAKRVVSQEEVIFNYIDTKVLLEELLNNKELGIIDDNKEDTIINAICQKNPALLKDNLTVTKIRNNQAQVEYQGCEDTIIVTFTIQPLIIITKTNLGIVDNIQDTTIIDALLINNPDLLKEKDNLRVLKIETNKAFITIKQQKEQAVTFIYIKPSIKKKLKNNHQNTIINALYEENQGLIKESIKVIKIETNKALISYDNYHTTVTFKIRTFYTYLFFFLFFFFFLLLIFLIAIIIIKRKNKLNS
ncbi:hypothetical protein [Candidatus Phytoplasma meliae]|uniref:Uncharacterized protein n=1 Tax=Candidatus Phytoplasma meliae TaxID=1848402 RepID=A0ABS5CY87_9MOLU|nr:hypothetical protein [Candidatus Phytoplasma meliae]MBP5835935.1 hypothetical protein [Candidatus Phytoplasma meliae]